MSKKRELFPNEDPRAALEEISTWEIIDTQGGGKFIGKVTHEAGDKVTLSPAFVYSCQLVLQNIQNPITGQVTQAPAFFRSVNPPDGLTSFPAVTIRWSSRRRMADYKSIDKQGFLSLVLGALNQVEEEERAMAAASSLDS